MHSSDEDHKVYALIEIPLTLDGDCFVWGPSAVSLHFKLWLDYSAIDAGFAIFVHQRIVVGNIPG